MTSSNGNSFRVTGHLCGEFTGPGEFPAQRPVTRGFDVFFDLRPDKQLSKQSWGWWFETPSHSLWRHRNVTNCSLVMPYSIVIFYQHWSRWLFWCQAITWANVDYCQLDPKEQIAVNFDINKGNCFNKMQLKIVFGFETTYSRLKKYLDSLFHVMPASIHSIERLWWWGQHGNSWWWGANLAPVHLQLSDYAAMVDIGPNRVKGNILEFNEDWGNVLVSVEHVTWRIQTLNKGTQMFILLLLSLSVAKVMYALFVCVLASLCLTYSLRSA